ncbi:hypothetical protein G6F61_013881 [Rhizopus arrhizus]|nr:hypothetical protein G6F61_013881 [Rhizopus arrhizus]
MSTFSPWQQRAFEQTVAALDADRLGHGLLICGPAGLGKHEVALALADHVLARGDAAHATRTRQLIAAGTHPDLQLVSFIPNKSGAKLPGADAAVRRGAGGDRRPGRCDQPLGGQCAAEDAGRAAGTRQVPAGHHRSAEAAGDRAQPLPAVQSQAPGRGSDPGPDDPHPGGGRHRGRRQRDRAAGQGR